ncbi:MAG UNVERIFIED_CONTAM: hypothetical protein LOD86_07585 [Thermobifida fusca]
MDANAVLPVPVKTSNKIIGHLAWKVGVLKAEIENLITANSRYEFPEEKARALNRACAYLSLVADDLRKEAGGAEGYYSEYNNFRGFFRWR